MNGMMRWINGVLSLLLIVMLVIGSGIFWFNSQLGQPVPVQQTQIVKVIPGQSSRKIADDLETQGIITSRHVFLAYYLAKRMWARANGHRAEPLKAGEYEIKPGDTIRTIIRDLTRGKSVLYAVTIPEGLTSYQIAERLKNNDGLTGDIAEIPKEGVLKPDTYLVPRNSDRNFVLSLMSAAQDKLLKKAWAARQENLPFKDINEAVTLAAIVQRETGPKDDPARIASVFINRLRKGMRLQSDPTILYGKFGTKVQWGATIYRSDIDRKTDYNTYQINGLPPAPICNPGAIAINAALNPARTEDIYFVADGRGGHIFSKTNAEHQRAVAKWRQIEQQLKKEQELRARAKVTATAVQPARAEPAATTVSTSTMSSLGFPLPERKPARP